MIDLPLPNTAKEIVRSKLAMFAHAFEYHTAKEDKTPAEVEWLKYIPSRIAELEKEA